jgi:hypothetical protein
MYVRLRAAVRAVGGGFGAAGLADRLRARVVSAVTSGP